MKAQKDLKFPSELCFGIVNATKDSYLLNSKVAKIRQETILFFYGAIISNYLINF